MKGLKVFFSLMHRRYMSNPLVYNCVLQALVDRPDEVRRIINFKRLVLTDFKIDIPRLAKKKVLTAALEESGGVLEFSGEF